MFFGFKSSNSELCRLQGTEMATAALICLGTDLASPKYFRIKLPPRLKPFI